jgi:hypothetical protein
MTRFFKFLRNRQFGGWKNDPVLQILHFPPWNWVILACKIRLPFFGHFEISLFATVFLILLHAPLRARVVVSVMTVSITEISTSTRFRVL